MKNSKLNEANWIPNLNTNPITDMYPEEAKQVKKFIRHT